MELVVVGCQSGDEGKGKFTDVFGANAQAVVRWQGGPHTGHTVVAGDNECRFVQLPAGMLRGVRGILGYGCVIDVPALREEMAALSIAADPSVLLDQ